MTKASEIEHEHRLVGNVGGMHGREMQDHLGNLRRVGAGDIAQVLDRIRGRMVDGRLRETPAGVLESQRSARMLAQQIPTVTADAIKGGLDEDWSAIVAVLKGVFDQDHFVTVLRGPGRSGKTAAACWWLSQREGGRYITASDVLALYPDRAIDRSEWRLLQQTACLVVDDLGRGAERPDGKRRLGDLISGRADEGLRTVVTTMQDVDLGEYGPALVRRCSLWNCTERTDQ